jgi:hypothetical protein
MSAPKLLEPAAAACAGAPGQDSSRSRPVAPAVEIGPHRATSRARLAVEVREAAEIVGAVLAAGIGVSVENGSVVFSGDTHDAFLLAGIETVRSRVSAVVAALALGPAFREKVAADRRASVENGRGTVVPTGVSVPGPTHCVNGHERNEKTTYHRPDRAPECRVCRLARVRRWKAKTRARRLRLTETPAPPRKPGPPQRTHCRRGLHLLDAANVSPAADGRRRCRTCSRERERKQEHEQ